MWTLIQLFLLLYSIQVSEGGAISVLHHVYYQLKIHQWQWWSYAHVCVFQGKESPPRWQDAKFPTECFTLTVFCHHLSILPVVRKHQRCLRAIRELSRIVEEMEASEVLWKHLPQAQRNRNIIKKYKSQCQVSLVFIIYYMRSYMSCYLI